MPWRLVMHGYDYLGAKLAHHFSGGGGIYCIEPSNRYHKDIYPTYGIDDGCIQGMSQVTQMYDAQTIHLVHKDSVAAALGSGSVIMVGGDIVDTNVGYRLVNSGPGLARPSPG